MDCPMKAAGGEGVILAYAGRSLGPDETVEFERHLGECAECRRIAAAQREVWSALDGWAAPPISENFDARLFARIAGQERWNWRSRLVVSLRGIGFRPMVPVAAACAAVMGVFLLRTPQIPSHPAPAQAQTQAIDAQQKVEVNQVERGLDDMDMLRQLGGLAPAQGG